MPSLLVKDLSTRVITSAGPYAQPMGGDGESSYSSANMLMVGEPDEREMSATFRICEGSQDDDGDIVEPQGFDLSRYKKNPCVLFHHDKDNPGIGMSEDKSKTLHLFVKPNEVIAKCFFHCLPFKGINLSEEIFHLVVKGALRGASVGFLPIEARKRGPGKDDGYHFLRALLTEWSITPIPSNSDTLRMCLSRGYVKSKSLKTRLESLLPPKQEWANGAELVDRRKRGQAESTAMAKKLGVANIEFDRKVYKTIKDCVGFLNARGYDSSVVSELPGLYVYKQTDAKPGAGQKSLAAGVVANLYVKKAKADEEEVDDETPLDEPSKNEAVDDTADEVEKSDDGDTDDVSAEDANEETEAPAEDTETESGDDPEAMKEEATKVAMAINHFKAYLEHVAQNPHAGAMADEIAKIDAVLAKGVEKLTAGFGKHYAAHAIDALAPMGGAPAEEPVGDVPLEDEVTKSEDEDDPEVMKCLTTSRRSIAGWLKKSVA